MATQVESSSRPVLEQPSERPSRSPWAVPAGSAIRVAIVGALAVIAFWPILTSLYGSWFDERAYMEHGVLVAPAAAYMAWTKRERLRAIPAQPSAWGALILAWGAVQALLGMAAHWAWASRTAVLISLVGCVAVLFGLRMVVELAYPLCVLLLMITPPTFVFERLTLSLQLLASKMGEVSLEALGFSVLREGNILELVGTRLSVEEACSGIRSLYAILFLCALYNYFFVEGRVMKALIFLMAVPIAILGNAGRIVVTGITSQYNRALISGTAHEAFGYVSVTLAGIGCIALHILMTVVQRAWRSRHA